MLKDVNNYLIVAIEAPLFLSVTKRTILTATKNITEKIYFYI